MIMTLFSCGEAENEKISWEHNVEAAVEKSQQKPILVDFMAEWCPPCQQMEKTTFSAQEVIDKADKFITVRIDVDEQEETAIKYNGNASKYGGVGIPNILFLDSEGQKIRHIIGYHNARELTAVMDSVLTGKYEKDDVN